MKKNEIAITLGIMCFLLTIAIIVQVNTINKLNLTVSKTFNEDSLRDEVLKWKEKSEVIYSELEKSEEELKQVREEATKNNSNYKLIEDQIKFNNNFIGLTNLKGKGIIITLADNQNVTRDDLGIYGDIADYLVHYSDIINVVNELKNAGAEAISINGQRVVNTTAISCIGNVIKINDEKINSPFTIKAIGFPESLIALDRPGGYLESLKGYVNVTCKKSDEVEVPKYNGLISAKYLRYEK